MKKLRVAYGISALVLFLIEVYIALFVKDNFIRPYFGDVLVTALLCCIVRTVFPISENYILKRKCVWGVPLAVFIFSIFIEICQYFHYVDRLGLGHIQFFRIVMGTGFAVEDIWCYGAGCLAFFGIEWAIRRNKN